MENVVMAKVCFYTTFAKRTFMIANVFMEKVCFYSTFAISTLAKCILANVTKPMN